MPVYPDFPTFPKTGMKFPRGSRHRESVETEFENGWKEVRTVWPTSKLKEFTIIFKLVADDWHRLTDFIEARKYRVEPFNLVHPHLGTGVVRYGLKEIPYDILVDGDPVWYVAELPFEGIF